MTHCSTRKTIVESILAELDHAYAKHGSEPWGRHEFAGILLEEVDELWDAVKSDLPTEQLLKEVMQIACVCIRYAETGDKHRGPHDLTSLINRRIEDRVSEVSSNLEARS